MTKQINLEQLNNDINAHLTNTTVRITLTLYEYTRDVDVIVAMTNETGLQLLKKLTDIYYLSARLRRYKQENQHFKIKDERLITMLHNMNNDTLQIDIDLTDTEALKNLEKMITSLTIIRIKNV
ncbi:hypothetical protein FHQ08_06500 [Lactobacillus sp. CC-MHH1034]|uniref:hypothetical protein n=1 Tax=Agrilactobacillus fermenti TaxID=2586909 RepID=UPI001E3C3842|nr:hypothetical protein [Agrilactobacillus fermenti]MCD2256368.1 hypothetical protein [Agrilactobacillus fermenti]